MGIEFVAVLDVCWTEAIAGGMAVNLTVDAVVFIGVIVLKLAVS